MNTDVVQIDPLFPDPPIIARAAALLRDGRLVAFPTETVYGLGADALNPAAVAAIFDVKGRPATNPIIVHVADVASAAELASAWPAEATDLAARFWPGPLTIVLPRHPQVPDVVTAGAPTVALRIPAHRVPHLLITESGRPLAAPSANRSSRLSPTRASHVLADFIGRIPLLLDGGPTPAGLESTVIDLSTRPPRLLRPGPIPPAAIESLIGPLDRTADETRGRDHPASAAAPLPSPGLLPRHYAPRTPLECVEGGATPRISALLDAGRRVGALVFGRAPPSVPVSSRARSMSSDPLEYAGQLYAALHEMDAAGLDVIVVELPPNSEAWLAVRDRLRRAASPAPQT